MGDGDTRPLSLLARECRFTLFTGWLIPVGASTTGTRHLIQCDGSGSGRFNKLDEKKRESARPAT